jgi:N-acyl-D-aspartate/D-glutamate deacylase
MLDTVLRGGIVIDGSGAAARQADVGIRDGRVAVIGDIDEDARETIDVSGKIVSPGFVDVHTHYDAQVFWDPAISPSCFHGVTTVVGGNCGFSVAPLTDESGPYLMRMLSRVEGMPLASLEEGVPWNWRSFAEYLDALEGKLALNAGFLVGHSAIRRAVMGEAAVGRAANASEVEAMQALLAESLEAGGLGFSSTQAATHNDLEGQPVPSRWAERDEFIALCRTVRDHPGTTLEFIPAIGVFAEEDMALMTDMSLAADRPLNWNVLVIQSFNEQGWRAQLAASDYAAERGAKVVALTPSQVMVLRLNFTSGFVLDSLPDWASVIALPHDEKMKALADPAVRKHLDERANSEEAGVMRAVAAWENMEIAETFTPENAALEGRMIGELAEELGKSPFDTLLDIALSENLKTSFKPIIPGDDDASWQMRKEAWLDPRTIVGASDAGAHLDMINTFAYSTALLGPAVREKSLMTLEEAIHQLTDVPARHYGLIERGRLEPGWHADITVFDPDDVGLGEIYTRRDLPRDEVRLYADAFGIERVFVNGTEIVRDGELTGARPGTILRSGRDSETVGASLDGAVRPSSE